MIVVFDTNIWISQLALRSSAGSAVRFYLKQQEARIGLPEIVKLETEENLRNILNKHIKEIETRHRQLLAVFGELKEISLPSHADVEELIARVFSDVGVQIEEIPFSLASARSSFIQTIKKLPPSDSSQQFKDGVLWADCVTLLKNEDVCLVTDDRAFYESKEHKKGLAKELQQDLDGCPNTLKIFPDLGKLLSAIETNVEIAPEALVNAYMDLNDEEITKSALMYGFGLQDEVEVSKLKVFITEDPNLL